jgi:hypothetical protein
MYVRRHLGNPFMGLEAIVRTEAAAGVSAT